MPKDDTSSSRPVRRRRVLYVHGYDPATSERYRRLIARAGAERSGAPPVISPVASLSDVSEGWRISAGIEGGDVETVFEVLRYEDIVRQWRGRPALVRLWTGLAGLAGYVLSGGFRRTLRVARGPALLSLYPVVMLALFIGLGAWGGGGFGAAAERFFGAPGWASQVGLAVGAGLGLWLSIRAERRFFIHLMLSLYDFMFRIAADRVPSGRLDMRVELFAHRIADCVASAPEKKVDEILIVGHSLGALVATKALARAMRLDVDLTGGAAKVSFLTLGSTAGYVACRGGQGADDYAAEVSAVAEDEDLAWVDVSAPRDWFSFGLVDPLLLVDTPSPSARSPRVISARFGRAAPDPDDTRTRMRAMSLHMKYLAAPDRDGGFDFFAVVAGPQTLAGRFAGRRNSPKAKMLAP